MIFAIGDYMAMMFLISHAAVFDMLLNRSSLRYDDRQHDVSISCLKIRRARSRGDWPPAGA